MGLFAPFVDDMYVSKRKNMSNPQNISELVASPRAVKALEKAGYITTDDVDGVPIENLAALPGVGQVSIEQLTRAGADPAPIDEDGDWDEGPHPIHLDSFADLRIRVTHSGEERRGKRVQIIPPVFLAFQGGRAKLTREQFMLARHDGDKVAAKAELRTDTPWRLDAIDWLKAKPGYKAGDFIILPD
jgi:hypothetical protein